MPNTIPASRFNVLASKESIGKAMNSLEANDIKAYIVETGKEAKEKALSLIPEGSEVMTMTSVTLDSLGISEAINKSGKYNSARSKLNSMNKETQKQEMNKLGSAPIYSIGSVHAISKKGEIIIASNTGSQLPAYAYGSEHVIFVVSTAKIVENLEEGFKRVYEYSLPLESERAKKAYGVEGSSVNKILIINKEAFPGRISVIFVNESLGF